ncbi:MAG: hypothetical protein KJO41_12670 [Bacteroidia bacterium]|nr:hypothetical protein [Bacteroidia bacterium]NND11386.1 hypothetical protein [Flavobacteriaceae bacterium]NND24617.1 hypothetical protein [Flavobacteriaceae bacterium]NNK59610.1 hypothetical protein [Flavobacteriaceae bacterium]RZW55363.1 MAG: hypothetical protein EX263_04880 [Flavobacteriaceae bacterium]
MKAATIIEIKKELKYRTQEQLIDYCLAMARFKLESKELLTYLVFESDDEQAYIKGVKEYISTEFGNITATNFFFIKKSVRKILRQTKRYVRYSKKKETEAELLIYFCSELKELRPSITRNRVLTNMYNMQLSLAKKAIAKLHEDLQYDYNLMIDELDEQ